MHYMQNTQTLPRDAIILLDKKSGVTSFSALNSVKRTVNRKAGHAGTLDKFASGLVIALCGKCTRLCDAFMGLDKTYIAEIEFGRKTDTLDPEGETVAESPVPEIGVIREKVGIYTGRIEQTPPVYSAIHLNGRRSSELARRGSGAEAEELLKARPVEIYSSEILSFASPFLTVRLHVSKGFYVRSYARDLALLCGSRAYVHALRRVSIGPFSVKDAVLNDDESALSAAGEASPAAFIKTLEEYRKSNVVHSV